MPEARLSGVQLDDTDKLAVSLYGKGTAAGDTALAAESASAANLRVVLYDGGNKAIAHDGTLDSKNKALYGLLVNSRGMLFNEAGWDRRRNNTEATLLASAARTVSTNSPDQTNYNARGVIAFLDVTAVPGTDTVTLHIQVKDPVSGSYRTIASSAAYDTTGTRYLVCYPGATDTGNKTDGKNDLPLPRTWRIQVTHSGTGSFTYSVGASLIL